MWACREECFQCVSAFECTIQQNSTLCMFEQQLFVGESRDEATVKICRIHL